MKPLLIVNPHAASRKAGQAYAAAAEAVDAVLGPVDAAFTVRRSHGIELAREAAEAGRELIVAVGGDGTFSEVVNGVMLSGRAADVGVRAPAATSAARWASITASGSIWKPSPPAVSAR